MAKEIPTISTDITGIPELIDNNINGIIVPQKDAEALAKAIIKIKDDKGYTPLPDKPIDLNPPGDEGSTGVTSWREVLP